MERKREEKKRGKGTNEGLRRQDEEKEGRG